MGLQLTRITRLFVLVPVDPIWHGALDPLLFRRLWLVQIKDDHTPGQGQEEAGDAGEEDDLYHLGSSTPGMGL